MKIQQQWKKFCFVIAAMIMIYPAFSPAATLHVIIAADTNDRSIGEGTKRDLLKVTELYNSVSAHTGMRLNIESCYGDRLTRRNLLNALDRLSPGTDDVAVFHYSGHGSRTRTKESRWPYLNLDQKLDLDVVVSKLQEKKPRFFIVMSDSCNSYSDSIFSQNFSMARPRAANYKELFLKYRGHIIASGSVPGEYSWTNSQYGGKFTHAFLTSLHENLTSSEPSWGRIMENAKKVIRVRDRHGREWEQHPQAEVSVTPVKKRPEKTEIHRPIVIWVPPKIDGIPPSWDKIFPSISDITPPKWEEIIPPGIFIVIWNNRFPPGISAPNWNSDTSSESVLIREKPGEDVKTLY